MAPSPTTRLSTAIPPPSPPANRAPSPSCVPDRPTWPQRTVSQIRSRWRPRHMQGTAPKILFMVGFLINSTAMSGLFLLLVHDWEAVITNRTDCLPSFLSGTYDTSIRTAFPFFVLVSLAVFAVVVLTQCRRYKMEENAYLLISVISVATFLGSSILLFVSAVGIYEEAEQKCAQGSPRFIKDLVEVKKRYCFQAVAAFFTSAVYSVLGLMLIKRRQRVDPVPATTPVYHVAPPDFDSHFRPPPTYRESQIHHLESQRRERRAQTAE